MACEARTQKDNPKEYLENHPYTGGGACAFRAVAHKSKNGTVWRLTKDSCLEHSSVCTAVGKVKARQLVNKPSFRNTVFAASGGGKATAKLLAARADDLGVGGVQLKPSTVYRARRKVEAEHADVFNEKFAALPQYLHDTCTTLPRRTRAAFTASTRARTACSAQHF